MVTRIADGEETRTILSLSEVACTNCPKSPARLDAPAIGTSRSDLTLPAKDIISISKFVHKPRSLL